MQGLLRVCFSVVLVLAALSQTAPSQDIDEHWRRRERLARQITSDAALNQLIAGLSRPELRLQKLSDLICFSSGYLYAVGSLNPISSDPVIHELKKRAAKIVHQQGDIETVSLALDSSDYGLQFWGLMKWAGAISSPEYFKPGDWPALLPKIKKLAVEGGSSIRYFVVDRLCSVSSLVGADEFIAERLELETSSGILERLVRHVDNDNFTERFNSLLLRSLNNQDEDVRIGALGLIGSNSDRAPVRQVKFNGNVFERVLKLTHSASEKEREMAACALAEVRHFDLDRSREAAIRLAYDAVEGVRQRVAAALKDQFNHEDVKPVIAKLLQDPSPMVRIWTILALGYKDHQDGLRRLTQCSDPLVAEWASNLLKKLERDDQND